MSSLSFLLGLGVLAGLLLVLWRAPQEDIDRYLNAAIWVLVGALIGSRAVAVGVNWGYYQLHPLEIIQVWLGGLSGFGALSGGALAIFILAIGSRAPMGVFADALLPLAGTLTVTAWLGCMLDRCAYGQPYSAFWASPAQDEWGLLVPRVPVQLIGAVSTLIFIWSLDRFGRKIQAHGLAAAIGWLGLSAELFALSFLRADPTPSWHDLRLDALGYLILTIISLVLLVVLLILNRFRQRGHAVSNPPASKR